MALAKFEIKAKKENSTKTIIQARNFNFIVDEPKNLGGTDEGPNPVEYIIAALAGCLSVVGQMVAKEMDFEIRDLKFNIDGELDPAGFMGKDSSVRPGYQNINVKCIVDTDANNEVIEKWLKIVEARCPVSDTIQHLTPVKIEVEKQ